jgi:anthranilate synthase component 2
MGLMHRSRPVHGVQFHPESIASEPGHRMIGNFLTLASEWNRSHKRP